MTRVHSLWTWIVDVDKTTLFAGSVKHKVKIFLGTGAGHFPIDFWPGILIMVASPGTPGWSNLPNETVAHDSVVCAGCIRCVDDNRQHHDCIRVEPHPDDGQGVLRMKPLHLVLIGFGSVVAAKIVKGLLTGWLGISF